MTTATIATPMMRPSRASGAVLSTAVAVAVSGVLLALVGFVAAGGPAAAGALIGTLLLVLVLCSSSLLMDLIASVATAPLVLVSLVTYSLHLVLLLAALVALTGSGLTESAVSLRWVGSTIIVGALIWSAVQVVLFVRTRAPIYDISEVDGPGAP